MKWETFLIALIVILGSAALLFVVMMTPVDKTPAVRDVEQMKVDGDYVHVFHDDKRATTCYVLKSSISCVKDANSYEDIYR